MMAQAGTSAGRAVRESVVEELRGMIRSSKGLVFVSTLGLNSEEDTELRKAMRPVQTKFRVVKNRLMRIACQKENVSLDVEWLKRNTAVAFVGEDAVSAVKILNRYAEAHENLKLKGGLVDGRAVGLDGLKALAALPGRKEMMARVAGTLKAPMTKAARDFKQVFVKMALLLKEASRKAS